MKKTVVLGASPNPYRYAFKAAHMLKEAGHEMIPVSIKRGEVAGEKILNLREKPAIDGVHTITMYIGPQHQAEWTEYLLSLQPQRIIFNPGTENQEFEEMARKKGIETYQNCTLVLLSIGSY